MQLQPIYKSAAFWTTVVSAIASVLVGLKYQVEAEALIGGAAIVIGYLASRGYVAANAAKAAMTLGLGSGEDKQPSEVKF